MKKFLTFALASILACTPVLAATTKNIETSLNGTAEATVLSVTAPLQLNLVVDPQLGQAANNIWKSFVAPDITLTNEGNSVVEVWIDTVTPIGDNAPVLVSTQEEINIMNDDINTALNKMWFRFFDYSQADSGTYKGVLTGENYSAGNKIGTVLKPVWAGGDTPFKWEYGFSTGTTIKEAATFGYQVDFLVKLVD